MGAFDHCEGDVNETCALACPSTTAHNRLYGTSEIVNKLKSRMCD